MFKIVIQRKKHWVGNTYASPEQSKHDQHQYTQELAGDKCL